MSATNAAILGQYGGNDQRVNATIPALEQVMQDSGKTFRNILRRCRPRLQQRYRPNYNQEAAVAAWQRTLDWFGKYLKA